MKRSTFFKSLLGLAVAPIAITELVKDKPKKRPFLDGGIINGPKSLYTDYPRIHVKNINAFGLPKPKDFEITGKEITGITTDGTKYILTFNQEIYAVEPITLTYNNYGLSKS